MLYDDLDASGRGHVTVTNSRSITLYQVGGIAPAITQQPQSQSAIAGSQVMFTVAAIGSTPLSYQWMRAGTNIPGAVGATHTLNNVQTTDAGNYSVTISNFVNKVTSTPVAVLTVNKANQTLAFGPLANKYLGDFPFPVSATASSGLAVTSLSIFSGPATINGVTVTLTGTGTVVVRATQTGNAMYAAVTNNQSFVVTASPASFATRQLPAGYLPGTKSIITINSTPPANSGVHAVEDLPPAGWTVGVISDAGSFDVSNGKVKFGPFFDTTTRAFTYELTAPTNAVGTYTFIGVGSAGGTNSPIGGASSLGRFARHPADNNPIDDRITIGEVTAYGLAWQSGATWPTGPNPIPIGYVTRAGALWKGGESYYYDPTITTGPLWWVNTAPGAPVQPASALPRLAGAIPASVPGLGLAVADLPAGFQTQRAVAVTIHVQPSAIAQAHAVEDTLPAGWTLVPNSITPGGAYDGVNHKVKWGPFFDTTSRVLTYSAQPGTNTATAMFTGVASFDGVDVSIGGRRVSQRGSWLPENTNAGRDVRRDGFRLLAQGEAGRVYVLEATATPWIQSSWIPLATNLNGVTDLDFTDLTAGGRTSRYYRVISP